MREIKFRAWDKTDKEMVNVDLIMFNDKTTLEKAHILDERNDVHYLNDVELMQYTGLKDKNGVEIYEGDIIEHHYGLTKVIYGRSHNEMGELRESVGFLRVGINNNDLWCTTSLTYGLKSYEVIGNIYQNPELLEK